MKRYHSIHVLSFFLLIILSLPAFSRASEEVSADEKYMIELINSMRQDPLAHAERLGFDRQALVQSLGWFEDAATNGFLPLTGNTSLFSRASDHNTIETTGITNDAVSPAHDFLVTGETGGVVSFYNFIQPRTAIGIVIDNLFKAELDPERTGARYILSDTFDIIGVSLKAGQLEDSTQRAYFITLFLADSGVVKTQVQVLTVINQIRANPFVFQKYLMFPSDTTMVDFFNSFYALLKTYEPLFYNPVLTLSATGVLNDKNDGLSGFEYAGLLGYEGMDVKQMRVSSTYAGDDNPKTPASMLISDMLVKESSKLTRRLLNPDLDEFGMGLEFMDKDDGTGLGSVLHYGQKTTTPADDMLGSAVPFDDGQFNQNPDDVFRIYGVVFSDTDGNQVYTPGEEINGKAVSIYDAAGDLAVRVFSDAAGRWLAALAPGDYVVEATQGDRLKRFDLVLEQNTFVPVDLLHINQ